MKNKERKSTTTKKTNNKTTKVTTRRSKNSNVDMIVITTRLNAKTKDTIVNMSENRKFNNGLENLLAEYKKMKKELSKFNKSATSGPKKKQESLEAVG